MCWSEFPVDVLSFLFVWSFFFFFIIIKTKQKLFRVVKSSDLFFSWLLEIDRRNKSPLTPDKHQYTRTIDRNTYEKNYSRCATVCDGVRATACACTDKGNTLHDSSFFFFFFFRSCSVSTYFDLLLYLQWANNKNCQLLCSLRKQQYQRINSILQLMWCLLQFFCSNFEMVHSSNFASCRTLFSRIHTPVHLPFLYFHLSVYGICEIEGKTCKKKTLSTELVFVTMCGVRVRRALCSRMADYWPMGPRKWIGESVLLWLARSRFLHTTKNPKRSIEIFIVGIFCYCCGNSSQLFQAEGCLCALCR